MKGGYVPAEMVMTPWGNASELRERKLRPGGNKPRVEVLRNQRERLFGALVAVVAEKGYEATTVADLVKLSGVSRSDFYEHFKNKEDCALAALETILEFIRQTLARSYDGRGGAMRALIELIVEQPATARFCFVEVYAAGSPAVEMVDQAAKPVEALFEQRFAAEKATAGMPGEIVRALVGGLRKIIHTRLYRGEENDLVGCVPDLWQWSFSYYPPPEPLRKPRRASPPPRQFDGYTSTERIARSLSAVMAEKGFQAMSTNDIAEHASISLSTFYAHFADKREALLAALEMGGAQMLATVVPAARRASDWCDGVRAVYEAMCGYLIAEPDFARVITIEVYAAGPEALARRDRIIESLQRMLAPGYEQRPRTPPIAAEAIGGAVFALLREQIRAKGPQGLAEVAPLATYITLVPFVGPERACEAANDDGRRR